MRKILTFIFIGLCLSCSQQEGYKIEISLQGAEGKVVLEKIENGTYVIKDSAEFRNGKAIMKGKTDFPDLYVLRLTKNDQRAILFVENAFIKVSGKTDSLHLIKISGSPVNDEFQTMRVQLDNDNKITMERYQEYQSAAQSGDTTKARQLMEEVQKLSDASGKRLVDYVRNNPSSWLAPLFLTQLQSSLATEELDTLVTGLDPKLSVTPYIIDIKKRLEVTRKIAIGQVAPDFSQNDPDGKPVRLSDVYSNNNYTLIDFWAAWCGPCRQENPNVVAVYNDFKGKGFTVFGVSLDQDHDRWVKAIQDDQLTWTHVSDLKYWQNAAAALYAVNSIPANFLVDKSGKIIARNLRGDDLRKKLAELLP